MADIEIDYAIIEQTAAALNGAQEEIIPELNGLVTSVDTLLSQSGGLWMDLTSPTLQAEYLTFTNSLITLVDNLGQFAQTFQNIKSSMISTDTQFNSAAQQSSSSS